MYFNHKVSSEEPANLYSAYSADGLTFTVEGARFPPDYRFVWGDPGVVHLGNNRWLMAVSYIPHVAPGAPFRQTIFLAHSTDGLVFTPDPEPLIVNPNGFVANATFLPLTGGRFRIYHNWVDGYERIAERNQIKSGAIELIRR